MRRRTVSRLALSAVLVGAGVAHFAVPRGFEPLIPGVLGPPRPWVLASGVAELTAGTLLAVPRTKRLGAVAALAVFLGVWPGNWQMAFDGGYPGATGLAGSQLIAWLRVPLQLPLLWWAWTHTRRQA